VNFVNSAARNLIFPIFVSEKYFKRIGIFLLHCAGASGARQPSGMSGENWARQRDCRTHRAAQLGIGLGMQISRFEILSPIQALARE
jgi:hypothetical protein